MNLNVLDRLRIRNLRYEININKSLILNESARGGKLWLLDNKENLLMILYVITRLHLREDRVPLGGSFYFPLLSNYATQT